LIWFSLRLRALRHYNSPAAVQWGIHPIAGVRQPIHSYSHPLITNVWNATTYMKRITILLVDDSAPVRRDIRDILELENDLKVVGEASNGHEAVVMVKKLHPALVLMDVAMPLLNGLQATRKILKAAPATKVLMLSVHDDDVYIEEATKSGAKGYLIKHTAVNSLCRAIRAVDKGKTFFKPSLPGHLHQRNPKK
jgi:DNA-binding NarL/FixJ family response regulator